MFRFMLNLWVAGFDGELSSDASLEDALVFLDRTRTDYGREGYPRPKLTSLTSGRNRDDAGYNDRE